tara:strand:- start:394 stop:690 length:297 start_codon:yes stop_codon:yes gene_type:complete
LIEKNISFEIRNYVKEKFNEDEIKTIIKKLKTKDFFELLRDKKSINFDPNKNKIKLAEFLLFNQKLIQRPIFFNGKNFFICRPPEKVLVVEGVGFEPT